MRRSPDLIVITGPTAVGKTATAVELAKQLDTEVISADSMQVYKFLTIGTAKPTPEELCGVPYRLIDFVDPNYQYNLGDFVAQASQHIDRLRQRGKLPILCGGTCMYIKGLLHGIFDVPSRSEEVRQRLARRCELEGLPSLYDELRRIDPHAKHIKPNDRQRIIRALEVYYVTGKPISVLQTQFHSQPRYSAATFILSLERKELYERINRRVDKMIANGLIDEVRAYIAAGFSRENPAFRALGYTEIAAFLDGKVTLETALDEMKKKTRHFAKRQLTWFRSMRDAKWINVADATPSQVVQEILRELT
ncbi:MAG: tRNA (adenosine(37)-N6)-dimethylallyltransferase MiaA [Candidatus Sumerlaeaceae bacterium]|nr:tRNA (adenosine(37)-N6)-dimethylallyltransferase MiaA [Candidatus Sumerlaeaceae bacterium]